jgi:hypothetical protein
MNDKEKLINCIKTNSIIYEQQYKINENICCFCLDTLSGKICYECKNYPDFENWPPVGY